MTANTAVISGVEADIRWRNWQARGAASDRYLSQFAPFEKTNPSSVRREKRRARRAGGQRLSIELVERADHEAWLPDPAAIDDTGAIR